MTQKSQERLPVSFLFCCSVQLDCSFLSLLPAATTCSRPLSKWGKFHPKKPTVLLKWLSDLRELLSFLCGQTFSTVRLTRNYEAQNNQPKKKSLHFQTKSQVISLSVWWGELWVTCGRQWHQGSWWSRLITFRTWTTWAFNYQKSLQLSRLINEIDKMTSTRRLTPFVFTTFGSTRTRESSSSRKNANKTSRGQLLASISISAHASSTQLCFLVGLLNLSTFSVWIELKRW